MAPLKRSMKMIQSLPSEVLVDVLSRKLVQFSLTVRDNSSIGLNTGELIKKCQEQMSVDEVDLLMTAMTSRLDGRGGFRPGQPRKKLAGVPGFSWDKKPQFQAPVVAAQKIAVCTVDLARKLRVVNNDCKHAGNCKFKHVIIANPCPPADKFAWKKHVESVSNSAQFKAKMMDAINALP